MIYYEVMFEAIQDRYNNGEITYEQAEELNELAAKKAREIAHKAKQLGNAAGDATDKAKGAVYSKFTGGYSKTEEDAFLDEYEQRINNVREDIQSFREMDKNTLTVGSLKSAFKKIMADLDACEQMLTPANMPKSMSNNALKKSPKYGRIIADTTSSLAAIAMYAGTAYVMTRKITKNPNNFSSNEDPEKTKKVLGKGLLGLSAAGSAIVAGSGLYRYLREKEPSPEKAKAFREQQKKIITEIRANVAELETISLK